MKTIKFASAFLCGAIAAAFSFTASAVDVSDMAGLATAFANGDLLGKGTRTIPVLPADVLAAMPDPNKIIVPPCD